MALFSSLQGLGFGGSAPKDVGGGSEPKQEPSEEPEPILELAPPLAPDLLSIPYDVQGFLRATPDFNFKEHINRIEVAFIKGALAEVGGSVSGAARVLGLQRTTLIEKMRKYAIDREEA